MLPSAFYSDSFIVTLLNINHLGLEDNFAKIIKGCLAGKRDYQEALYKLFSGKMYGLCLRYTKDRDEAQDILQEGFIKVFSNLTKFDNRGSFEGWIRRIIINVALERFRKTNYMYPVEDITIYKDQLDYDDMEATMSEEEMLKLIQELSPKYRMVFNLYAIEGYSHSEISQMLNISEGTSKSNLSRARVILQEKLKEYSKNTVKFG